MQTESQIFLTTTDATRIPKGIGESVFDVVNGEFYKDVVSEMGGLRV